MGTSRWVTFDILTLRRFTPLHFAREKRRRLFVVLLLATSAGCGRPRPVPVSGCVTLDGKPVADAGVLFCPTETGPSAAGTTDTIGRFQLATINTPGVLPGPYRVTITKQEILGVGQFGAIGPQSRQIKWIVPEKYGRVETSGLSVEVSREKREFDFPLSSH